MLLVTIANISCHQQDFLMLSQVSGTKSCSSQKYFLGPLAGKYSWVREIVPTYKKVFPSDRKCC